MTVFVVALVIILVACGIFAVGCVVALASVVRADWDPGDDPEEDA